MITNRLKIRSGGKLALIFRAGAMMNGTHALGQMHSMHGMHGGHAPAARQPATPPRAAVPQRAAAPRQATHQQSKPQPVTPEPGTPKQAVVPQALHGGQITAQESLGFEVVFEPKETRVYLYGMTGQPISAHGVEGQVTMQPGVDRRAYAIPLEYVASPDDTPAHDYLAVPIDVSRIQDGGMTTTFELTNLPNGKPKISFTQVFALSRSQPIVSVAAIGQADQVGIAQQRVCPVLGAPLGQDGKPIKVLIDDHPVYLCCGACLSKVQDNPGAYLPHASSPQVALVPGGLLQISKVTADDQPAVQTQRLCAVMESRLGQTGTPVKIEIDGQAIFVCCEDCVAKVEDNPAYYAAQASMLRDRQ